MKEIVLEMTEIVLEKKEIVLEMTEIVLNNERNSFRNDCFERVAHLSIVG